MAVIDTDLIQLFDKSDEPALVTVKAADYAYDGWLVMIGWKKSGKLRCVVEDANGRLFIHNASQIRKR